MDLKLELIPKGYQNSNLVVAENWFKKNLPFKIDWIILKMNFDTRYFEGTFKK